MNASLTRKHFEALAAIIAEHEVAHGAEAAGSIREDLVQFCRRCNPAFDAGRFRNRAVELAGNPEKRCQWFERYLG